MIIFFVMVMMAFSIIGIVCVIERCRNRRYACSLENFSQQQTPPGISISQAKEFLCREGVQRLLNQKYGGNLMSWRYCCADSVLNQRFVEVDCTSYDGTFRHYGLGLDDIYRAVGIFLLEEEAPKEQPENSREAVWIRKNAGLIDEKYQECMKNGYTSFVYSVEEGMKDILDSIAILYTRNMDGMGRSAQVESGNLKFFIESDEDI